MPKLAREIENPIVRPIKYIVPLTRSCSCGCGAEITIGDDDYIIIDGMSFLEDSCVTEYFIGQAGGRRVYA